MKTISQTGECRGLILSFSPEEAVILFAPGAMFRLAAESASWRGGLRFIAPKSGGSRLLVTIPGEAIRKLLEGVPGHPAETELKQLLFDAAPRAQWPDFTPAPSRSLSL
jgi:hypothetical protein